MVIYIKTMRILLQVKNITSLENLKIGGAILLPHLEKFVTGTLKLILWGTIGFLVLYFGYQGVQWLMENYQSVPK